MLTLRQAILSIFAVLLVAGCSPQDKILSAEELQKPENAAALQKTIASCNLVMATDSRAKTCAAAHQAKFALEAKEIGRIRREQIAKRTGQPSVEDGVTVVEKSPIDPSREARQLPIGKDEARRADLEASR